MNKLGINMDMNKLDMNKFSIGVQRRIKEVQKNIKLMKKEALVESFDDLKLLLKCRITNEYYGCLAVDDKGKRQQYRHPDLDKFSKMLMKKVSGSFMQNWLIRTTYMENRYYVSLNMSMSLRDH